MISDDEQDAKRQKNYYNAFEEHCEQIRVDSNQAGGLDDDPFADDEFEHWQATHRNDDKFVRDPIAYWHEKRFQYPRLSRMALDFLTIQSMSAEWQMVVPQRSSLHARTIGMCQVLRSWFRANITNELNPLFLSIMEEKRQLERMHLNDD
ncbi:hypothetical protein LIPSTDRAFT_76246, partial [Lipomyces starkeyi NRRL Y-11557]